MGTSHISGPEPDAAATRTPGEFEEPGQTQDHARAPRAVWPVLAWRQAGVRAQGERFQTRSHLTFISLASEPGKHVN